MRLITHNLLQCHVKSCTGSPNSFPLQFQDVELTVVNNSNDSDEDASSTTSSTAPMTSSTDYNPAFLIAFLPRLDWPALYRTALELGITDLPMDAPVDLDEERDEAVFRVIHRVLFLTHITAGIMQCRNCERQYPIKNGIPNMLLQEDEI